MLFLNASAAQRHLPLEKPLRGSGEERQVDVYCLAGFTPALDGEAADETESPPFALTDRLKLGCGADDLIHAAASGESGAAVRPGPRSASAREGPHGNPQDRTAARWRDRHSIHAAHAAGSAPTVVRHPAMSSPSACQARSAQRTRTPTPTGTPWCNLIPGGGGHQRQEPSRRSRSRYLPHRHTRVQFIEPVENDGQAG